MSSTLQLASPTPRSRPTPRSSLLSSRSESSNTSRRFPIGPSTRLARISNCLRTSSRPFPRTSTGRVFRGAPLPPSQLSLSARKSSYSPSARALVVSTSSLVLFPSSSSASSPSFRALPVSSSSKGALASLSSCLARASPPRLLSSPSWRFARASGVSRWTNPVPTSASFAVPGSRRPRAPGWNRTSSSSSSSRALLFFVRAPPPPRDDVGSSPTARAPRCRKPPSPLRCPSSSSSSERCEAYLKMRAARRRRSRVRFRGSRKSAFRQVLSSIKEKFSAFFFVCRRVLFQKALNFFCARRRNSPFFSKSGMIFLGFSI